LATQDGNWLVVAPGLPASGRANTVNRNALGILLRAMDKEGTLRLDDVANFAIAQNKAPSMNDFDMIYPRLINSSATNRSLMPLVGNYSVYRFYGTLTAGQRQAVQASQQIPFMNLSQQQIGLIADLLYNSPQGP